VSDYAVYPFVLDLVKRRLPENGDVLEVGCGAMQYGDHLGPGYRGLDLPSSRYLREQPHYLASAEQIPAEDAMFDVVFGVATFYYMPDVRQAFAECRRVLRPGGALLVFDYRQDEIARMLREGDDAVQHVWDKRELRTTLKDAGFAPRRIRDLSHRAGPDGDPPLVRRPVRLAKSRLSSAWTNWVIFEARAGG
jgi:SAM-dependent methyltransferase